MQKHSEESSRQALIQAGKSLFAQKGFDGTTVREISAQADVNLCLVSYHFQGKEGLYRTCLEQFGQARLASARRLLKEPTNAKEFRDGLKNFVDEFFQSYLEDPEAARLIHRELDRHCGLSLDIFRETFLKAYETLVDFFRAAQEAGVVAKDCDCRIASSSVYAAVVHFTRNDWMSALFIGESLREEAYRTRVREQILEMVVAGVIPKRKKKAR